MSSILPEAIRLYSNAELRAMEAAHAKARPRFSLMQRAGEAVATLATDVIAARKAKKRVLILAGPGNNGGDAWVTARVLQAKKIPVLVWTPGEHKSSDPAAQKAQQTYRKAKGAVTRKCPTDGEFATYGLIVDGLFGIGLNRPPAAEFAAAIAAVNQRRERAGTPVLAIDIPSGLSADSGHAFGEAIAADFTLTFLGLKPGLYTADGVDCCGEIHIETLGANPQTSVPAAKGELLNRERAAALIPQRRRNSHKGSYGNAGIIGGAEGMVGAAVLAARAALHMGPGKVYLGLAADTAMSVDAINPEIMLRPAIKLAADADINAFAVGMGLGDGKAAARALQVALSRQRPIVIDADALNLMASNPSIGAAFKAYASKHRANGRPQAILAPHPGEAARLLKTTPAKVQQDRIGAAHKLAACFSCIVVLKGAGTVIAMSDGRYFINTSGNPGMASGGMGDALSGMMAAFMAQGLSALDAALLGVYLHGAAADACLMHGMGPLGLTASEVIFEARTLLNSGLEDHHDHLD
ncbi:MAG TPA: NAD(P)H-hydrate dehydratase [Usitatibacteraceae bacterium]